MKVNIVNPGKHKKASKNVAEKKKRRRKRKSTSTGGGGGGGGGGGRKKRRRRRRSNPATPKRRANRRRKNPTRILSGLQNMFGGVGGMVAGELFAGFIAQRMQRGATAIPGLPPANLPSPYGGAGWSWWNYLAIAIGGQFAGNFLGRLTRSAEVERNFKKGVALSIVRKLIWTEGFARSPWMQQAFGNQLVRTSDGSTYYQAGANQPYNAMMGYGSTIVPASPLDGGQIVPASPLDGGRIVRAGPLDTGVGVGGRRYGRSRSRRRRGGMGSYYPSTGEEQTDTERHALWLGAGSTDLYQ